MHSASTAEAALRAVLPRYGIEETAEVSLVKYRENHVYRVTDASGRDYAARIHRVGYRSTAQLDTEANYLLALAGRGLRVPRLLPTTDGAANVAHGSGGQQVVIDLQDWIDQAAPMGDIALALDGDRTLAESDFHALGGELGKLHVACQRIGVPGWFARGAWDAAGLAGPAPLWGDPAKLPSLDGAQREAIGHAMAALRARLAALPVDAECFGVIHADLTPENVLVSHGEPTLIDFDDFGTGWHLFDLVTVLFFYTRHPLLAEYRRGLEAGYRAQRPQLPAGFFEPWEDLLLARGLTYLGWAAERHGDEEATFIETRVVPVVMQLIGQYQPAQRQPSQTPANAPANGGRP